MDIVYWYVVATLVALTPIYLIKQYVISSNAIYLLLTMLFYTMLLISYIKIFEVHQVSSSYTILQITQIMIVVIMGLLFFNDSMTTNKALGLCSGILSIYLLT